MEIMGLDVSSYQGKVDWKQVAAAGYRYVVLRSVTRGGTDVRFEENYRGARKAGLSVGVYAFSYAMNPEDAKREAKRVLGLLRGRALELPVFIDLEWSEQGKLGRRGVTEIALAFLQVIEADGYRGGVYCSRSWYRERLEPERLPYDFWIASYGVNNGAKHEKPKVSGLAAWQYTSQGSVPGIADKVDLDIFYKEYGAENEKKSGWREEDGEWHFYLGDSGEMVRDAWYEDQGKWYWFNGAGEMVHDAWYEYQGDWYYLTSDGAMATGLIEVKGSWYFMWEDGRMAREPVTFVPDSSGALQFPSKNRENENMDLKF